MYDGNLRDLELAGIQWEITDVPMVTIIAERAAMAALARQAPAPDIILSRATATAQSATATPAQSAPAQTQTARVATSVVPPIAPVQSVSIDTVRAMAARPIDIPALMRMIAEFNHPLRSGVTNVVLPHIAPNPNGLVIVTDIPGADDDANARIMSGAAGELLDKMLAAIGMSRDNVSIVPMLFWRTPGGRGPTRDELDLARPFVDRILEMLHARVMLTLGTLPAAEVASITLPRNHGVLTEMPNGVQVMPIYHPNYLMLKPAAKRDAWNALQIVQNLLKSA